MAERARPVAKCDRPSRGSGLGTGVALLVLDALRALEPRERAVTAYHLDGFTGPEIASALRVTDQQARDALKKARKILAARLPALGNTSGCPAHAH
jgi:DNA-directed RNA polymerase specialized sigma24 family protein